MTTTTSEKYQATDDEILTVLGRVQDANRNTRRGPYRGMTKNDLAEQILKNARVWDPSAGPTFASAGQRVSAQMKMRDLERSLDRLMKTGAVVRYRADETGGAYATSGRALLYFTREVDEKRIARDLAVRRNSHRRIVAQAARETILARHDDEVKAEYKLQCEAAGLAPEPEETDAA